MSILQTNSYFDKKVPEIVLRSLFDKYDSDHNDRLDAKEFNILVSDDLGLSMEQTEAYRYLLDRDADGRVSFEEFAMWFKSGDKFKTVNDKTRYYYLKKAVEMFKVYDLDHNGAIDSKEFHKLYKDLGGKGHKKEEKKALLQIDLDHNGKVSFQEFMKWLNWVPLEHLMI